MQSANLQTTYVDLLACTVDSTVHASMQINIGSLQVYMGILIQIGCVYMEAYWIQIQTQTTSPIIMDCDPDSNPDLGPGSRVNSASECL